MQLEEKNQGEIAIISIHGNLVGTCEADSLHGEIEKFLNEGIFKMVLDLSDVHWMGSLCIGALMREIISARKRGGDVHLSGLSAKVLKIIEITKLNKIINIYPTTRDAVEGFKL